MRTPTSATRAPGLSWQGVAREVFVGVVAEKILSMSRVIRPELPATTPHMAINILPKAEQGLSRSLDSLDRCRHIIPKPEGKLTAGRDDTRCLQMPHGNNEAGSTYTKTKRRSFRPCLEPGCHLQSSARSTSNAGALLSPTGASSSNPAKVERTTRMSSSMSAGPSNSLRNVDIPTTIGADRGHRCRVLLARRS